MPVFRNTYSDTICSWEVNVWNIELCPMGKRYHLVEQKSWRSKTLLTSLEFSDDLHTIAIMLLSGRVLCSSTETDSSFMQKKSIC